MTVEPNAYAKICSDASVQGLSTKSGQSSTSFGVLARLQALAHVVHGAPGVAEGLYDSHGLVARAGKFNCGSAFGLFHGCLFTEW